MQLDFWMAGAPAQARQRAMLGLAKQRWLCIRQHQREARREVRSGNGAHSWLLEIRQRRIPMVKKCLRIELDLARGGGKSARSSVGARFSVLGVLRPQSHADPLRRRPKLLQGHPGRRELMAIRSVDIATPELRRDAQTACQVENDIGVRPRFTRWR